MFAYATTRGGRRSGWPFAKPESASFEKRSKNFGQLVAVLSRMETYIGKRFWFFFAKKKPLSWRRPVIEFLGMRCLVVSLNLSGEFLVRRARV